jgi:hypothetical protein
MNYKTKLCLLVVQHRHKLIKAKTPSKTRRQKFRRNYKHMTEAHLFITVVDYYASDFHQLSVSVTGKFIGLFGSISKPRAIS